MNHLEDSLADIELYFKQLIDLTDLMIETDNTSINNLITLKQLSESGLKSLKSYNDGVLSNK